MLTEEKGGIMLEMLTKNLDMGEIITQKCIFNMEAEVEVSH